MRHEGHVKMGHYPSPIKVIRYIRSILEFPTKAFSSIDPCCGTGEALAALVEGTKSRRYGVELDQARCKKASWTLDHAIQCDYFDARISRASASLMLLNVYRQRKWN